MIACFSMFLLNDIYGFINWIKMKKRQQVHESYIKKYYFHHKWIHYCHFHSVLHGQEHDRSDGTVFSVDFSLSALIASSN
jgi:hypothetical protein